MPSAVVSPWRAGRRRSREQRGFPCASSSRHKSWLQKGKKEKRKKKTRDTTIRETAVNDAIPCSALKRWNHPEEEAKIQMIRAG